MKLVPIDAPPNWQMLTTHDICEIFPCLDQEGFDDLEHSMKEFGFDDRHSIVVWKGKILDGRNRLQACRSAKQTPKFLEFEGTDDEAIDFVIRENVCRRDLTKDAKCQIVLDLEQRKSATLAVSSKQTTNILAKLANASTRRMERNIRARKVAKPEDLVSIVEGKTSAVSVVKRNQPKPIVVPPPPPKKDRHGYPMNPRARAALKQAEQFVELIGQLRSIKLEVRKITESSLGRLIRVQPFEIEIDAAMSALRYAAPYSSCPMDDECEPSCKLCGGTQWIGESQFESLPDRLKPKKD